MEISKGMCDSLRKYVNVENVIDICISTTNNDIDFLCFATDNQGRALKDYCVQETNSGTKVKEISYSHVSRIKQYSILLSKIPQNVSKICFFICSKEPLRGNALPNMAVRQNNLTVLSLLTDKYVNGDETAIIMLELYRKEDWKYATVLQGYNGGVTAYLQSISFTATNGDENKINELANKTAKSIYSEWAGKSIIDRPKINLDKYGNAAGGEYDLVKDNTFDGEVVYVLNLCSQYCTLEKVGKALARKGFIVMENKGLPDFNQMKNQLNDASQFWLISGADLSLTGSYVNLIKEFFEQGHGIYIWGDNDPWYADANIVISNLFHIKIHGNSPGGQVVSLSGNNNKKSGIIRNHLISTGVVNIYEGITVDEIETDDYVRPLIYGSNERVIAAIYDYSGKRALIDGGFTRLYEKWDSAGIDRYIVNAAAWLVNSERFREKIKINKKVI